MAQLKGERLESRKILPARERDNFKHGLLVSKKLEYESEFVKRALEALNVAEKELIEIRTKTEEERPGMIRYLKDKLITEIDTRKKSLFEDKVIDKFIRLELDALKGFINSLRPQFWDEPKSEPNKES